MTKPQLTIFYAVVGPTYHDLLRRSLRSLRKRIKYPHKVKIISPDFVATPEDGDIEIVKYYGVTGDLKQKHHNWQMRYHLLDYCDTDYALYVDCDTVFVNDTLEELINKVGDKIGLTRHFWIKDLHDYSCKALSLKTINYLNYSVISNDINIHDPYYASGVMLFANTPTNNRILSYIRSMQKKIMPDHMDYIEGLTDELWLATTLSRYGLHGCIQELSGAFNHCFEPPMPLELRSNILYGSNPQDKDLEKILIGHCDVTRRDPGRQYGGLVHQTCREMFYL